MNTKEKLIQAIQLLNNPTPENVNKVQHIIEDALLEMDDEIEDPYMNPTFEDLNQY